MSFLGSPPPGSALVAVGDFVRRVADNVERVIFGKRREIEYLLVAMLCDGHVLIEDVPGTGKTMLARSVAVSLGCRIRRLQCTPDLLPNDITGLSVFNQRSGEFVFHPGPFSSISCWRTRSTGPRRVPRPPCSRPCRSGR